jgi:hypothetical protein
MLLEKPPERKPNALIKGHVFDDDTQEPIAGAKVMILRPKEVFQPELLDEMPAKPEQPVEKSKGTRAEDREAEEENQPELLEKTPEKHQSEFSTTTDRNGYFELKIPDGAHVLVVASPGYYKAVRKFVIDPEEELTVRVPMELWDEDSQRPGSEDEGKLKDESSETDSKGSSWLPTGAEGATAMLNAILAGLLVVLVILSLFVFRKYKRKTVSGKRKAK